jgi:ATP-dependent Clp protease ATP-binding subunit ClpB
MRLLRNKVTDAEIAEVLARWTGIPVARMMEGEREKLLRMEQDLHHRVIGQNEAVEAVSNAIRRSRAGCPIQIVRLVRSCSWGRPGR